jgi:hypothetical protein
MWNVTLILVRERLRRATPRCPNARAKRSARPEAPIST